MNEINKFVMLAAIVCIGLLAGKIEKGDEFNNSRWKGYNKIKFKHSTGFIVDFSKPKMVIDSTIFCISEKTTLWYNADSVIVERPDREVKFKYLEVGPYPGTHILVDPMGELIIMHYVTMDPHGEMIYFQTARPNETKDVIWRLAKKDDVPCNSL